MYFVEEWQTMSAPRRSGFWRNGVAKVLSTASRAPARFANSAMLRMSTTFSIGFVGVSTQKSFVSGRTAASVASGSVMSARVASMPSLENTLSIKRNVPPYTSSQRTTWSPAERRCSTAASAEQPDAKATPWRPLSSDARFASSAWRVGFAVRE